MPNVNSSLQTAEDVEHAYYDALGRADIDAMMALWADNDNVVCIHPGAPRLIGHASIRASFESIFERGGILVRPVQVHVSANESAAVRNVIEQMQRNGTQSPVIHILATNIYVKTAAGWRMLTHHASTVPGEEGPEPAVSALLH